MDEAVLKKEKIKFIKDELKKFSLIKRNCKYAYKNWFKSIKPIPRASIFKSPNSLLESPSFPEIGNNHYFSGYGKVYITCLHIIYNDIRHSTAARAHTTSNDVYNEYVTIVDEWLTEKISFKIQL